ncbi:MULTISPECIES: PepSY domain-containing protein [Dyella]|uniref:PepSY domain-containing protein n=2 Tax=Dyella TaxID=231454 RepID=A0A4R0YP30_9GAMM|nr:MULTISPECIES: PepSY domain-containing protein [Dyella]TBR37155.1 PepSY domain-containing protein [Dyella terrae]TCI07755.1 PepSY domain-containing protein [Dyella soli]
MKTTIASLAIVLALGTSTVMAQDALTERQINTQLEQQGYTKIHDLKFKDGVWQATARSADGTKVDVKVDPKTGQTYPEKQVSRLSERDVKASLSTQGYTHVHDVGFKDGVWRAKAENPAGADVKLQIDPQSGRIVGTN